MEDSKYRNTNPKSPAFSTQCRKREKYGFWEKFLLYFVIWSSGGATVYQSFLYSPKNLATIPILILCYYVMRKYKVPFYNKTLYLIVFGLFVWGLIGTVVNGYPCNYIFLIYNICIVYLLVNVFRERLFYYYEKELTFLSAVSLVPFFLVILIPGLDQLFILMSVEQGTSGLWESNLLLFGIQSVDPEAAVIFPRRNLGFAWEPGRFSVLITFALFINIVRHKFKVKNNRSFWILFFTLITTQSTTGYVSALVVALLWLYNSRYKKYLLVPSLIIVFLLFTTLPFMGDKIIEKFNFRERTGSEMAWYGSQDQAFVPQRFEGLLYDFLNFINKPIWGYGTDWKNSYVNTVLFPGALIYASDGLIQIFASCGIIVASFLYYYLAKSSYLLSSCYRYKGSMLFLILFLSVSVSYNFFNITIFLCFIFFSLFFVSPQTHKSSKKRRVNKPIPQIQ